MILIGERINGMFTDVKQAIADSWPNILEDYAARVEWGWKPEYTLETMTEDMLNTLQKRLKLSKIK